MLSTMRNSWLLVTLLALIALSSAMNMQDAIRNLDGIEAYLHHGVNKRADGTGSSPSATAAETDTETSAAPQTSATPAPASSSADDNSPSPTPDPTSDAPSSQAQSSAAQTQAPSSNAPASNTAKASSNGDSGNKASSTQAPKTTITTPVVKSTPLVATSYQSYQTVYTTILSNGQQVAVTSVASSAALITTGTAVTTETPLPQSGSGNSGSGLSDTNKKIVGGVIGGVGGAILLGGLAIVAWRIWGRKKRVSEDDDDLMAGTGSALGDKAHSPNNGHSPFQTNLEQYHNPGGRPNAAANF